MYKIFTVLVLVLVSGLTMAADFRADMTQEEIDAEIREELGLDSMMISSTEDRPTIEELVNEAIEAGVDIGNLVGPAIKYAGSYGVKTIKSILVVAAPADRQAEIFQKADAAINSEIQTEQGTLGFWQGKSPIQAQWSRERLARWESALGTSGFGGGGSTAREAVSGDS